MKKHSAGPWSFHAKLTATENHNGFVVRTDSREYGYEWALAKVEPGDSDGVLGEANARLIAAAPELLASLKALSWAFEISIHDHQDSGAYQAARAAIAKATGEA